MVRVLNKELYGQWILFITGASLLDMLRFGLSGTGSIRAISSNKGILQFQNIAASYIIGIGTLIAITLVFLPAYFILETYVGENYYLPILQFYPLIALGNLALKQASTVCQGLMNFKREMLIKVATGILNLLFIGSYILLFEATLSGIIVAFFCADMLFSLVIIALKWDGWNYLKNYNKKNIQEILHFGKYSTASFVGSNLLRSSDTFILSFSTVMGASAIAIYAIPLKFVELVEIPLRSFTATSFPKMSKAIQESNEKFNLTMGTYLSFTVMLIIPIIAGIILFANILLPLLGGSEYADSLELQKNILYVICLYIFLLPADRYSGMGLFALNKPKQNFIKIMIMLLANVVFDLIAVFVYQSLVLMAFATVLFTFVGVIYGWQLIKKQTGFTVQSVPAVFWGTLKHILHK